MFGLSKLSLWCQLDTIFTFSQLFVMFPCSVRRLSKIGCILMEDEVILVSLIFLPERL